MPLKREYSFCEAVTASDISPWCIRPLTEVGRKCGGGVDTSSLCGRVKEGWGWDLEVTFDLTNPSACKKCLAVLTDFVTEQSQVIP